MKLNEALELITEAMVLPTKDAPDWVKKVFKDNDIGLRTIQVIVGDSAHIWSHSDNDAMRMFFFVNGKVEEKIIATMAQTVAMAQGRDVKLWSDLGPGRPNMVLVIHGGEHSAELFAHPEQMPKQIENKESNLTDDEKKVLLITQGNTSAYRNEELKRYKVYKDADAIRASLMKKGLLTGAGALNIAGKNEVEKIRAEHGFNALTKLFGYGD